LSYTSDKLPALLGLAMKIKERTGLEYLFGHWIDNTVDIIAGFLWSASGEPMRTVQPHRAPSWSWSALDGKVAFLLDEADMARLEEHANDLKLIKTLPVHIGTGAACASLQLSGLV
jgi:hypothetical protein